jgi:hypothetical protein
VRVAHRLAAVGLVFALGGCATASTPPTTTSPSIDAPPTRSLGDVPGDAPPPTLPPTPSPGPTAFVAGPSGDPWQGPAEAWPGRALFTFPDDEDGEIVGVGTDGTIFTLGTVSSTDYHVTVRAFGSDGTPIATWPADGVTLPGFFGDAILGTDGGIYVAMHAPPNPGATSPEARSTTLTAIDPDGRVRAGWPIARPKSIYEHSLGLGYKHDLVARPAGGICFVEDIATSPTKAVKVELVCLDADGRPARGWPYRPAARLGSVSFGAAPVFGADGTLYVESFEATAAGAFEARILALGADGRERADWRPVEVVPAQDATILAGDAVYVLAKDYQKAPVLTAVDADDGSAVPGFDASAAAILEPLGAEAYPVYADLAPDGTIHISTFFVLSKGPSVPAEIIAIGPDGRSVAGWPFRPGAPFVRLRSGPDGALWAMMSTSTAGKERMAVLGADGAIQAGWPVLGPFQFHDLAFDANGVAFFVNRPEGLDLLETIDPR